MINLTYYKKIRDIILLEQKINKNWESKQTINIEIYLKKKKTKRENMEKTDIITDTSEKKKQKVKEYQKNY